MPVGIFDLKTAGAWSHVCIYAFFSVSRQARQCLCIASRTHVRQLEHCHLIRGFAPRCIGASSGASSCTIAERRVDRAGVPIAKSRNACSFATSVCAIGPFRIPLFYHRFVDPAQPLRWVLIRPIIICPSVQHQPQSLLSSPEAFRGLKADRSHHRRRHGRKQLLGRQTPHWTILKCHRRTPYSRRFLYTIHAVVLSNWGTKIIINRRTMSEHRRMMIQILLLIGRRMHGTCQLPLQ